MKVGGKQLPGAERATKLRSRLPGEKLAKREVSQKRFRFFG
jgi:hypothetical protein